MIRSSRVLMGSVLLVLMTVPSAWAQYHPNLQRIVAPFPNGTCPSGYHVVIVNTPGGAQRACST